MTLTKSHLIYAIAKQNGITRKKSTETVEIMLELIKSTFKSGEDVLISEFGKFCEKEKRECRNWNPMRDVNNCIEDLRIDVAFKKIFIIEDSMKYGVTPNG